MARSTPFDLLRELLRDDLRDRLPWSPEDFAQRVDLAIRESGAGRSWTWAIIGTYHAWHDAYEGRRAGALERFDLESLMIGES